MTDKEFWKEWDIIVPKIAAVRKQQEKERDEFWQENKEEWNSLIANFKDYYRRKKDGNL